MNAIKITLGIAVITTIVTVAGCGGGDVRTTSLGGGYEEVVYTRNHISEPQSHTIALQFRNAENRHIVIWPSLLSATVVTNDVAVFVAERTTEPSKRDGMWQTNPRLFAIKSPGPPLDITGEVVGRWAAKAGKDAAHYLEDPEPIEPQNSNGLITTEVEFPNDSKAIISLSWDDLTNIMQVVNTLGTQHTDPKWNLTYIEKEK